MLTSSDADTLYANCSDGDVRLSGGSSSNQGRLEVCINHAWGTVCNNGFSSEEALVACRQLGKLQVDGEYGSCFFLKQRQSFHDTVGAGCFVKQDNALQ